MKNNKYDDISYKKISPKCIKYNDIHPFNKKTYIKSIEMFDDKNIFKNEIKNECGEYDEFTALKTIINKVDRIIALGDVHSDLNLVKKILKKANIIDNDDNWCGQNAYVVQVGDQIDSYRPSKNKIEDDEIPNDINILIFFSELHRQAYKQGGAVISLLGNHELMNVLGDMRYVSYNNLSYFDKNKNITKGTNERIKLFSVGNKYAKYMACTRFSAVIINDILFAHAGILPEFAKQLNMKSREDLEIFNNVIKMWLLGKIDTKKIKYMIMDKKSLFWNRIFGNIKPNDNSNDCSTYFDPMTTHYLKIGYMIVGHSPQSIIHNSSINSTCNGKLWRVDSGSSYSFDNMIDSNHRYPQALEIILDHNGNKTFSIIKDDIC